MNYQIILLLGTMVAPSSQISLSTCGPYLRRPQPTDISVTCGTSSVSLTVEICPAVYAGYNESLLILNYMLDPACGGTVDEAAVPPVARYNFPINMTNSCGSRFRTSSAAGTGVFSDFSNIQTVHISGAVRSYDPTTGAVTYNAELRYFYSCVYPLEYLINNTQVDVSSSSVAVKDSNGSFINTLNFKLFCDINCTMPLMIPPTGLQLRTNVYAHVKSSNLTGQYHILLDRCYASLSSSPTNTTYFNLFTPCVKEKATVLIENGESHRARFSFRAFRFILQNNQTVSSYYLHCITRFCTATTCSTFKQCNRRKRSVQDGTAAVSQVHTLTSPQILIQSDSMTYPEASLTSGQKDDSSTGLGVALGILAFSCIAAGSVAAVIYTRLKN